MPRLSISIFLSDLFPCVIPPVKRDIHDYFFVANNFFPICIPVSSFPQSILQRGGTFRIFVPFCGTLLKPLSDKGLSVLFPKFCRIPRPNVPPLSILQYRASFPPSKKFYIAEPASYLSASASLTPNRDVFLVFGTILAKMLG